MNQSRIERQSNYFLALIQWIENWLEGRFPKPSTLQLLEKKEFLRLILKSTLTEYLVTNEKMVTSRYSFYHLTVQLCEQLYIEDNYLFLKGTMSEFKIEISTHGHELTENHIFIIKPIDWYLLEDLCINREYHWEKINNAICEIDKSIVSWFARENLIMKVGFKDFVIKMLREISNSYFFINENKIYEIITALRLHIRNKLSCVINKSQLIEIVEIKYFKPLLINESVKKQNS